MRYLVTIIETLDWTGEQRVAKFRTEVGITDKQEAVNRVLFGGDRRTKNDIVAGAAQVSRWEGPIERRTGRGQFSCAYEIQIAPYTETTCYLDSLYADGTTPYNGSIAITVSPQWPGGAWIEYLDRHDQVMRVEEAYGAELKRILGIMRQHEAEHDVAAALNAVAKWPTPTRTAA